MPESRSPVVATGKSKITPPAPPAATATSSVEESPRSTMDLIQQFNKMGSSCSSLPANITDLPKPEVYKIGDSSESTAPTVISASSAVEGNTSTDDEDEFGGEDGISIQDMTEFRERQRKEREAQITRKSKAGGVRFGESSVTWNDSVVT